MSSLSHKGRNTFAGDRLQFCLEVVVVVFPGDVYSSGDSPFLKFSFLGESPFEGIELTGFVSLHEWVFIILQTKSTVMLPISSSDRDDECVVGYWIRVT